MPSSVSLTTESNEPILPVTKEWDDSWSWLVIDKYFEECGMVRQQVESFNTFISSSIQAIIDESPHLEFTMNSRNPTDPHQYKIDIHFGQVSVMDPIIKESDQKITVLTPAIARMRNLTYAAPSYVHVTRTITKIHPETHESHVEQTDQAQCALGDIPIMLRSAMCVLSKAKTKGKTPVDLGECEYDEGGYFVINGSEKVLIAQERITMNQIYVFHKSPKMIYEAQIRSVGERSAKPGLAFYVRCYPVPPRDTSVKTGPVLRILMPYCKKEIPMTVLFRAFGLVTDKAIMEHICYGLEDTAMMEMLRPSLEEGAVIRTQQEALSYIGAIAATPGTPIENQLSHADKLLRDECFPHLGTMPTDATKKVYFLGYMIHKLILTHMGKRPMDDRDHFGNKRMDTAGMLLGQLYRSLFYQLTKSIKKCVNNELHKCNLSFSLSSIIDEQVIGRGLKYSLSTGNWGAIRNSTSSKVGVAQVLNRLSFASTLSHLRRLNTPLGRDGKLARPRQLHNTHWGMVCPAETPEGHACGLVKNLSMMADITVGATDTSPIRHILEMEQMIPLGQVTPIRLVHTTKVLVNGAWLGIHDQPTRLVEAFRRHRRASTIRSDTSVVWDMGEKELRIHTDAGRICRPVLIVDKMRLVYQSEHAAKIQSKEWDWNRIQSEGLVEYIDTEEEESCLIAMTPRDVIRQRTSKHATIQTYTHCEIHPSLILGVCASIIPFPDHNQSPRVVYQSAMGKQAIGIHASNFAERFDTMSHVVFYPQKPLCETKAMKQLHFNELPAGQNTIVAIACYSGYNQEDSLILNHSSIDRGWQRSTYYRTYRDQEKTDKFALPNRETVSGMRKGPNYEHLDVDGMILPGSKVSGDDMLFGKISSITQRTTLPSPFTHKDQSNGLKAGDAGVVDGVMVTTNEKGQKLVKVRVRTTRIPKIGDKFASRHGQKGTCGMLYRQEDMPFTQEGISPDLVMNPHAIPSRMTIGHLFETLLGKVACMTGNMGDATPFTDEHTVQSISKALHKTGYQRYGNERLFNGHTGKPLESMVYFGPAYYQRLKHMVDDKVHSRSRGQVTSLVRQPTEGRSRGGGLRFGEMERDCMISHGASAFLRERLFLSSDPYKVHTCSGCGLFAVANVEKKITECKQCKNSVISTVRMPYSCKLLFQELMSMAIAPRMITEDSKM